MNLDFSLFSTLSFCYPALLGGIGIALLAGPLGAFLIWQRLVYLGDALAHSSFLGVGIALLGSLALLPSTLLLTLGVALVLHHLSRSGYSERPFSVQPPPESLLLLLSQGLMGVGLLLVSLSPFPSLDLMAYLVGDLLTLSWTEVAFIWGITCAFGLWVSFFWKPLLSLMIHPELALIEGISVQKLRLVFLVFTSLTLVFVIQITGILLVSMLLVCPTLIVYPWRKTPYGICWSASLVGILAVLGGFFFSIVFDLPTGPLIGVILFVFFCFSQGFFFLQKRLAAKGVSLL